MKSLKELFEQYSVPVDESGWAAIANDAAVRKHNRSRKVRRAAFYGAAALATVAVVVTAITLTRPQDKPAPAAPTQVTTPVQPASTEVPALATTVSRTSGATNTAMQKDIPAATPNTTTAVGEATAELTPSPLPSSSPKSSTTPTTIPVPMQPVTTPALPTPSSRIESPVETPAALEEPITLRSDPDTIHPQQPQIADKRFFAPNAFSPNGDGVNDIFYVYANTEYTDFELNIYSRNGDHVFQARHIEQGWNGRRNGVGDLLPSGVYVYTIKYRTASKQSGVEKGQITLIQ